MAELECETVFTIPVLGGVPISESTVVTWIIMVVITLLCIILARNLSVENPSRKQLVLEICITKLHDFIYDIVGHHGKRYIPYLMTVIIYLGFSNLIGYFGFKPPTKDLNVTLGLSIMSIILIQYASVHKKGVKGWIKSFAEPIPIILPINIMELVIKPLSLCMRLFGNVLGAFVIMELIKIMVPVIAPIPFSLYFDLFDGLIQAYVFVFLTSMYIQEAVE